MEKRTLILLALLLICANIFSQKQDTLYYNMKRKASTPELASFYRVVNYDVNGKPVGEVKGYYITGKIQSIIEGAIFIDKLDDANSILTGKFIGFFHSGKKHFKQIYNSAGELIYYKLWYQNGNISDETIYKNGKKEGVAIHYHKNGTLAHKVNYKNGEVIENTWSIDCNDSEKCRKSFNDLFYTKRNLNKWPLFNSNKNKSEIIPKKGLKTSTTSKKGLMHLINLSIDYNRDFSILISLNSILGEKEKKNGLIWGFKDRFNYNFFFISADSHFSYGTILGGEIINAKNGPANIFMPNKGSIISVHKTNDKIYYEILSDTVGIEDSKFSQGDSLGFYTAENCEVTFSLLQVHEFLDLGEIIETNSHQANNVKGTEAEFSQNKSKKNLKPKNGISFDKWPVECFDSGGCYKIFEEYFLDSKNLNNWPLQSKGKNRSEILVDTGLKMTASSKKGFFQVINLPFSKEVNFEISAVIKTNNDAKDKKQGLVWDYVDEENYRFFLMSRSKQYSFGYMKSGKEYILKKGFTKFILPDAEFNIVTVVKIEEEIVFSINKNILGFDNFSEIKSDKLGFYIDGEQTVFFQGLKVSIDFNLADE